MGPDAFLLNDTAGIEKTVIQPLRTDGIYLTQQALWARSRDLDVAADNPIYFSIAFGQETILLIFSYKEQPANGRRARMEAIVRPRLKSCAWQSTAVISRSDITPLQVVIKRLLHQRLAFRKSSRQSWVFSQLAMLTQVLQRIALPRSAPCNAAFA